MNNDSTDLSESTKPYTAAGTAPPPTQAHNERTHSADESVHTAQRGVTQVVRIHLSDRALSVMAIIIASLSLGLLIMMIPLIEAKVQAGVARSEATSHAAEINARVALDKLDTMRLKLAESKALTLDSEDH